MEEIITLTNTLVQVKKKKNNFHMHATKTLKKLCSCLIHIWSYDFVKMKDEQEEIISDVIYVSSIARNLTSWVGYLIKTTP